MNFTLRYGAELEPLAARSLAEALATSARDGSELLDADGVVLAVRWSDGGLTAPTTPDGLWVFSAEGLRRAQAEVRLAPARPS